MHSRRFKNLHVSPFARVFQLDDLHQSKLEQTHKQMESSPKTPSLHEKESREREHDHLPGTLA